MSMFSLFDQTPMFSNSETVKRIYRFFDADRLDFNNPYGVLTKTFIVMSEL